MKVPAFASGSSPPRTRGARGLVAPGKHVDGIIPPADAGSTVLTVAIYYVGVGSSPRTRGSTHEIPPWTSSTRDHPADAGEHAGTSWNESLGQGSSRGRGEHVPVEIRAQTVDGSSRGRGEHKTILYRHGFEPGSSPADAGEHLVFAERVSVLQGSSPRTRGGAR